MPVSWATKRAASVPASGAGTGVVLRRAPSSSGSRGGVLRRRDGRGRAGGNETLVQSWHALAPVSLALHRSAFLDALLARDSARARRAVDAALADGGEIPDVYLEVLEPALAEIGHRWAIGELNVAEEHYA